MKHTTLRSYRSEYSNGKKDIRLFIVKAWIQNKCIACGKFLSKRQIRYCTKCGKLRQKESSRDRIKYV